MDQFGTVDILINNAAIYDGLTMDAFEDLDVAEWDRVMAVNVKGTWLATRAVAPLMKEKGYGKIVNISSTVAYIGPPLLLHYVASKGAVVAMTKALAKELGEVRDPGDGRGPRDDLHRGHEAHPPRPDHGRHVHGDAGHQGEDAARARRAHLLFLCSPESDFVVGQNWVVDGGMALQ